jgi:hypothetical protein
MSRDGMQTKREFFRPAVQAVLDAIRVIMTQKDKTVPVLMKQLALNQDEASYVYDGMLKGWAKDGRTTPGSMKLEFELDQRDMDLKEMPKPEQIYDYSILDELAKQKR